MAFCINCGSELPEGARFCPSCGKEVAAPEEKIGLENKEQAPATSPRKCPHCGELVDPYATECPACGLELHNMQAVSSLKQLSAKLESAQDDAARAVIVKNYPIPNSREDIMEFLIMTVANIDEDAPGTSAGEERLSKAWIAKAEQVIKKAELMIPGDETLEEAKASYKKKAKAFNRSQGKARKIEAEGRLTDEQKKDKEASKVVMMLLGFALLMFLMLWSMV